MNNEDSPNNSASSELNFIDQWSNVTVLKEISKGASLRQLKLKQSNCKDVYDTFNYNYNEPSTSKSNQMHQVLRKPVCIKTRKTKRRKSPKRCPMRIAELAVPTKRQCIDTWRTNATVIPNFMVERLKQRVMDQKPIVLIADAVNCFERRKRKPRNRMKKSHSVAENNRMKELKMFCAIFGYKITLKLRRPMNLSLNYRLAKIKTVVKEEIDAMLRCKKKSRQKVISNKEILEEISQQVTVWIDTVLDESDCKLLEENLLDLEEEEGPVLDLIDDLVDEVLIICEPPSLVKSEENLSEDDFLSHVSKDKSTEELISNITEENVNELIVDLYTNVLEDAELQILEKHDDYLLSGEIGNDQQSVDLLSIRSDSEHVLDNVRGELNKLVDQILDNLITDSSFKDEIYIADEEETKEISSQLEENNTSLLQVTQDSESQENNVNANEDLNIAEKSEIFNVDTEHNEDDPIINDLEDETSENDDKIKEIINDLLNTVVWSSEPNVLDDNYTKPNDTEVIKQESLEIDKRSNNEKEDLQNEAVVNDNESKQERQDLTHIKDEEYEETDDLSLSTKINEGKQIVQDLLLAILENFALESTVDENETYEENKKVKFSAIDMDIGVNKKLLTKLSSQQLILQKPSSDYLNLNIDFAPPNENLLSNADESWPQNIALPIVKVTASVNKSVTSLGKIFELDERRISSESSYVSSQNSEMLVNVQLTSMSMGNSNINDMLLAQFQNENKIIVGKEETNKKGIDKPQRKVLDKKKQVKKERNISETKHDMKPRVIDKNKSKDQKGKIRNKSVDVDKKPEKIFIKKTKDKEQPRKDNRLLKKDNAPNKTDRKKVSDKRDVAKNKINENKTGIKQKKQLKPEVSVKEAELITEPLDIISKEDRGDGLKNEQKQEAYSCEKFFSSEQKTKLSQNGILKIDAYEILKWCKGLENVIENLETWNSWMNSTCKCITYLKQRGSYNSLKSIEKSRKKWKMLHRNIKQDTILWRDMKQRNWDGLKSYKKYYNDIKNAAAKHVCDCYNNCQTKN